MFNDKQFLENRAEWPKMNDGSPYCCIKRKQEHAFITTWDNPNFNDSVTIALGFVFDGGTGETKTYKSFDELLKDGWIVD